MGSSGAPDRRPTGRTIAATLLVGLLVAAGGCTALGSEQGPLDPAVTTTTPPSASSPDGETTTASEASESSVQTTTAGTTTGTGDGESHDGHDHNHGDETATTTSSDEGDPTNTSSDDGNATATSTDDGNATTTPTGSAWNVTGQLTVVVGDREVTAGTTVARGGFRYDAGDHHTWTAADGTTLAAALSALGVEATADSVTYGGETYRDGAANTAVDVRVNGQPVDPEQYVLRDGDEVWVTVETPGMERETPGEYIRADDQHVHGHMRFVVDGAVVDFGEDRYQSGHRHFHFEGGHADPWHAHSFAVTLGYAMGTLDGIEVAADVVTYDGTTYRDADPGTSVSVTVNGEPVDPATYYLKDGDDVRVVVETDS